MKSFARAVRLGFAFLVRSLATYASYPARLSLGFAGFVVSVITFYYVGRVVSEAGPGFEVRFGMAYSSYALVGIAVHGLGAVALTSFRSVVRREQLQGTLETLAASATPAPLSVFLSGAADMAIGAVSGAGLLALATVALSISLPITAVALAALALHTLTMCGLGLASAGVVVVTKEGDPLSWAASTATALLGGVYFPTELLPVWAQRVACALPTFHALRLARHGAGRGSLAFLAACAASSLIVGTAVLRLGLKRARRDATMGQY